MPAKKKPVHKVRRLRHKIPKPEELADASAFQKLKVAIRKMRSPQPKRRKKYARRVHPAPMELGITPYHVEGPGGGSEELKRITRRFFGPLAFAMLLATLFGADAVWGPPSTRLGPKPPFVEGPMKKFKATYNPKSTGIEFEVKDEPIVQLRHNVTYVRQYATFDLMDFRYRNFQMVYIYVMLGRDVQEDLYTRENLTYSYDQHLRTSITGMTADGLGAVDLQLDYEQLRRVDCKGYTEWCRKLPVGMLSEINYPLYEVRTRFSRPARGEDGAIPMWNETIPIKARILYEYVPESWLFFELCIRYGYLWASMKVVGYHNKVEDEEVGLAIMLRPGSFAETMWRRPLADWSAPRAWCLALFATLVVFNEPLYIFQVWVPEAQDELRRFHMVTVNACVAVFLGHAVAVFYAAKYVDPAPPSSVRWVVKDLEVMVDMAAEEARRAERDRLQRQKNKEPDPIPGQELPPSDPLGPAGFQPPPTDLRHTPLFYMASSPAAGLFKAEAEAEAEAKLAASLGARATHLRKAKRKPAKAVDRQHGKGPFGVITPETDTFKVFWKDAKRRLALDFFRWLRDPEGTLDGPSPRRWRGGFGPLLAIACGLFTWLAPASCYLAHYDSGPHPRPRLTLVHALDAEPALAEALVVAVCCQFALILGVFYHAVPEMSLMLPVYLGYYAITLLFSLILVLGVLNCSFYAIGATFTETVVLRTLVNVYAWVVVVMVMPLEDDGSGRFPKRDNMGPAFPELVVDPPTPPESDEEAPPERKKIEVTNGLAVPSMGAAPVTEENSGSESGSGSDSDSDSGSDPIGGGDDGDSTEGGKGKDEAKGDDEGADAGTEGGTTEAGGSGEKSGHGGDDGDDDDDDDS